MPFKPIQFLDTNRVKLSFTSKAVTAYGAVGCNESLSGK